MHVLSALLGCAIGTSTPAVSEAQTPPIPQLAQWQSQMLSYGQKHCAALQGHRNGAIDPALNAVYYDGIRVFYQIAAYTGDSGWHSCAQAARYIYRDRYVMPNNVGVVPGYWNFTTGLRMDVAHTNDPVSRQAAVGLSQRAAYAPDVTPLSYTTGFETSRETAYAIVSYIDAEALGQPRRARRQQLVNHAYDHLRQMVQGDWGTDQMPPFMLGLTAHALIRDWEQTHDPRLIPALADAADFLWTRAWDPGSQSLFYQINPANAANGGANFSPAPDLNLLVAPLYAWLWNQTGDQKYQARGDAIFASGVAKGPQAIYMPKQFNQNYWWSFDYVKWRGGDPGTSPFPPLPPPTRPTAATVTFNTPRPQSTVQQTVTVSATATGPVSSMKLYLDGVAVAVTGGASTSYQWNTAAGSNGAHQWIARAFDSDGDNVATTTLNVTVNNQPRVTPPATGPDRTPPGVSLSGPGAMARGESTTLTAQAGDNTAVAKVEFYLNGSLRCTEQFTPYECAWTTPGGTGGRYEWRARAYDAAGNVNDSAPLIISVR